MPLRSCSCYTGNLTTCLIEDQLSWPHTDLHTGSYIYARYILYNLYIISAHPFSNIADTLQALTANLCKTTKENTLIQFGSYVYDLLFVWQLYTYSQSKIHP